MSSLREALETHQVAIYFAAIAIGAAAALWEPRTVMLEPLINPALALMLFVTFLQVPLAELGRAFTQPSFLGSLLVTNFLVVPVLVAGLLPFLPSDPLIRLGVLLVLLTPCIDYVVTFAHLGRADARLLLASTPILLIVQMLLLPAYLTVFMGDDARGLVRMEPFLHAFAWLIAAPLALAALVQLLAGRSGAASRGAVYLRFLPVPATALVLFIVIAAVVPQLGLALNGALRVVPIYVAFAIAAPLLGWIVARSFRLEASSARAVAFSAGTRNSLVVLPLAFAVPNAMPLLPAIIVAQTLVELVSELAYIRWLPKLGSAHSP
jgi:ACR3 family arsenite efflux pump ArsB